MRSLAAPDAGVDDVEEAAGAVLITTENFGMVSGLMKDFLERIYPWFEEVPNRRPGLPYLLISKGGNDGTGAVRDVTRIVTGLRWKEALPPIVVAGAPHRRPSRPRSRAGRHPHGRPRRRRVLSATALPPPTVDPQTPPMPAVDLVVTDLDGTFWHTDDHLPDGVLDAVAELERRGIPLLVATGRRLASTRDPLASFGLAPPAIMLNGAIGIDLRTGERFHTAPYPAAQALAAYDAFVAAGLSPVVYVDHPEWDVFLSHQPDTNPAHVKALGDTAGRHYGPDERTMVDDLRAEVARTPVLGFSMIGVPFPDAEAAFAALDGVVEVHLDRSIDFPGRASLTAAPRGQSKWDGVLAYCTRHDLDPHTRPRRGRRPERHRAAHPRGPAGRPGRRPPQRAGAGDDRDPVSAGRRLGRDHRPLGLSRQEPRAA